MQPDKETEIAIIGCGIAGIATAFYLARRYGRRSLLLIDPKAPMSYTSAQSGDNYRNWWPHPTMIEFANHGIDLLEALAEQTSNVFRLNRRGYLLATRHLDEVQIGCGADDEVITDRRRIRNRWPALSGDIATVVHLRRAGDFDSQRLGAFMLDSVAIAGARRLRGTVTGIDRAGDFRLSVDTPDGARRVRADAVVIAAGPYAGRVASMLGVDLPVRNVYQQKIAFEDTRAAVPRDMPFTIDLDEITIPWADELHAMLAEDSGLAWLTRPLPGGRHCRPDGGVRGKRLKLGWAFNSTPGEPRDDLAADPALDAQFPEIVLRAAATMLPSLAHYVDSPPAKFSHYGGYYTMTEENWPLIGPLGPNGAFTVAALSGFGSMVACAAGELCAAWVCGGELPSCAANLSMNRLEDPELLEILRRHPSKGIL